MFTDLWALLPPPRTHSWPSEKIKNKHYLLFSQISKKKIKTLLVIKTNMLLQFVTCVSYRLSVKSPQCL